MVWFGRARRRSKHPHWAEHEQLIADLSKFYHLQPGDLIFTGTPEGVGPLQPGDRIEGRVEGVGTIALSVGPAE